MTYLRHSEWRLSGQRKQRNDPASTNSAVNKRRQERKYERQERPNERLNYINNMKTGMTELTTINQSTPINYINNGETARNDDEDNIVSVTILRGTTVALDKKPSNQIQKYEHEQLRCKKPSFSILNYRRGQKTRLQQIQDICKLYINTYSFTQLSEVLLWYQCCILSVVYNQKNRSSHSRSNEYSKEWGWAQEEED